MRIVNDQSYLMEQELKERSEEEKLKSLAFYRELASDDPDTYEPKVAEILHSLASQCVDSDHEKGEQLYMEALEIRRRICAKNPEKYESAVAETARCLGMLHNEYNHYKTSVTYLLEALDNYRRCSQRDPDAYEPELAMTLYVLGMIYNLNRRYITCEKYYHEALEIFQRPSLQNADKYAFFIDELKTMVKELHAQTELLSESEKQQLEEQELPDSMFDDEDKDMEE